MILCVLPGERLKGIDNLINGKIFLYYLTNFEMHPFFFAADGDAGIGPRLNDARVFPSPFLLFFA